MTLRSAADPMAQQGRPLALSRPGRDRRRPSAGRPGPTAASPAPNSMRWPASWRTSPGNSNCGRCWNGSCGTRSVCWAATAARSARSTSAAGTYRKEVDLGVACRSGDEFPLTEGVTGEILRAGGPVTFAEYGHVRGGHIDPSDRVGSARHHRGADPLGGRGDRRLHRVQPRPGRGGSRPRTSRCWNCSPGTPALAMVNARMHAQAAELARAEATGSGTRTHRARRPRFGVQGAGLGGAAPGQRAEPAATGPNPADPAATRPRPLDLARLAAQSALTETRRTVLGLRPALPTGADHRAGDPGPGGVGAQHRTRHPAGGRRAAAGAAPGRGGRTVRPRPAGHRQHRRARRRPDRAGRAGLRRGPRSCC